MGSSSAELTFLMDSMQRRETRRQPLYPLRKVLVGAAIVFGALYALAFIGVTMLLIVMAY
jgi:hypothetical protein